MAKRNRTGKPKHVSVVTRLIQSECILGMPAGSQLPGLGDLAKRYKVSRNTVDAALHTLQKQGLVDRRARKGTFVAEAPENPFSPMVGKCVGVSFLHPPGNMHDSFTLEVIQGFFEAFRDTNLNLNFLTRDWYAMGPVQPSKYFDCPSILGILIVGQHPSPVLWSLKKLNRPLVAVDVDNTRFGMDSFCFDNFDAGAQVVNRLLKLGHRRFAGVFESPEKPSEFRDPAWDGRRDGFLDALKRRRIRAVDQIHLETRGGDADLISSLKELIARPRAKRPTAYFVPTRSISNQIESLAAAHDLKIPQDLSIVSCSSLSDTHEQTVVAFDGKELGLRAARRMISYLGGRKSMDEEVKCYKVNGHFIVGQTHASAPGKRK